jgi:hypothetical protein
MFAIKTEQTFRIAGSKFTLFDASTCNVAAGEQATGAHIEVHMQMFTNRRPI